MCAHVCVHPEEINVKISSFILVFGNENSLTPVTTNSLDLPTPTHQKEANSELTVRKGWTLPFYQFFFAFFLKTKGITV